MGCSVCRRRAVAVALALVLLASAMPPCAWAASGAGNAPAPGSVQVSAEGDAALLDGASFGLSGFSRAQAGSNRAIEGVYCGYNYYVGDEPGKLAVVATDDYAVCYIPQAALDEFSLHLDDPADLDAVKSTLVALDAANAKGSSRLEDIATWHFTGQPAFEVNGAAFSFDREVTPGRFYTCILGSDGADLTGRSHPAHTDFAFADFARLAPPDRVVIAQEAAGLARLSQFLGEMDYRPLFVTLKTTGTAIVFVFILGLAAAYFTMRLSPRAQDVFDSVFTIPMVLPPTVCGFLLLLAFGRNTPLGQWFIDVGFPLVFSWPATVIAAVVVAFPLMYRSARGAFEGLDARMLDAARTLGWSDGRIFFRLMLPLSWSSVAAGTVLAFARALGEFGATLFMAGNAPGITTTIPIAIYFEWMNGRTDVALFWVLVIMLFSFVVILFINLWSRRTTMYRGGARGAR